MNEKRKRALAGCLLLGALVIWVPELLSAQNADKPAPKIDRPAIADWNGMASVLPIGGASTITTPDTSTAIARPTSASENAGVAGKDAGTSSAVPPAPLEAAAASSRSGSYSRGAAAPLARGERDLTASLERSLALARSVLAEHPTLDIDALARRWTPRVAAGASFVDRGAVTGGDRGRQTDLAAPGATAAIDPVDSFLSDHPLNGILDSPRRKLANLGGLLVGEGDELIPGVLKVTSIGARAVIVSTIRGDRRIELAAQDSRPEPADPGSRPGGDEDPPGRKARERGP